MSVNQIRVSQRKISKPGAKRTNLFIVAAIVGLLGVSLAVAVAVFPDFSNQFNYAFAPLEVASEAGKTIIRVPAGGDVQAAINRAKSGDTIELAAGATYYGELKLPNKPLTDYITIQTSAAKQLPETQRITPAQSNLLAKIVSRGKGAPAVSTENGANYYRFVGIEFTTNSNDYIYNLVFLGEPQKAADAAHHIEIDRCYFHPSKAGITRRGLAVNSRQTTITNSYFTGFAYPQQETQAICGWTGTKDVKIINNHLEGGAENVLFGGADPFSADLIPADIEIRGNYFYKPAEWKDQTTTKCLFELKNALRVQFVGNYLENNWYDSALRITVRNQDGKAEFSTIEDVLIKDNVISGAGAGVNILGRDDTHPSQTMKRLNIVNNVFLNIGGGSWDGAGYFIQISGGEDITIANNTSFNTGNIASFHGDVPRAFVFRDNIVGHGSYGIHGYENIKSPAGQKLFQNNVIVNNGRVTQSDTSFPPGNIWVPDYKNVGFVNVAQNDFRLAPASRFKGKGKDQTDIGSNLDINNFLKR